MDKFVGNYRFSTTHLLGRGSFGIVYKGKSKDQQLVAVKVIDKRLLNEVTNSKLRKFQDN